MADIIINDNIVKKIKGNEEKVMQYYDEVQEVNERRKRRILEYYEYIDARTRDQMSEVVHKLTEQRQSQGLSQQDIAEATGMAAPNIARLESCKRIPTMQVLAKYADAVGMEINIEVVPIAKNAAEED